MTLVDCYLGLGSNLENPKQQIDTAIQHISALPQTELKKTSAIYQSKPAHVTEQPDFFNAVVLIQTAIPAHALLKHCLSIEQQQKRKRLKRFGPRTIDIDILLYGHQNITTDDLVIPHPRLHLRDFMLIPLLEIWPEAKLPGGKDLKACLTALTTHHILSGVRP